MADALRAALEKAGLGHQLPAFEQAGVTNLGDLQTLTMQDYQSVGVVVMSDRRKLFELIQNLKRDANIAGGGAGGKARP